MTYNSVQEWKKEAVDKFGEDWKNWKFKCYHCNEEQTGALLIEKGIEESDARNQVYQECCHCHGKSYGFIHTDTCIKNNGNLTYVHPFAN